MKNKMNTCDRIVKESSLTFVCYRYASIIMGILSWKRSYTILRINAVIYGSLITSWFLFRLYTTQHLLTRSILFSQLYRLDCIIDMTLVRVHQLHTQIYRVNFHRLNSMKLALESRNELSDSWIGPELSRSLCVYVYVHSLYIL